MYICIVFNSDLIVVCINWIVISHLLASTWSIQPDVHCRTLYKCVTTEKCQQHLCEWYLLFDYFSRSLLIFFFYVFVWGKNKINKHLMKSQFIGSVVFIAIFPISTQHVLFFILSSIACSIFNQIDNKQYLIWVRCTWSAVIRLLFQNFTLAEENWQSEPKRLFSIFKFYSLQPHTQSVSWQCSLIVFIIHLFFSSFIKIWPLFIHT